MRKRRAEFDPDYHETKEALPLVYDLGRLAIEWNMVEHFFTTLIWQLLGDFPTGMAVTGGMGNQSKADVILKLARERIRNPDVLDRIEFACKAFNTLRENRNMLVHSHSIFPPEKSGTKPIWSRATGRGPTAHARVEADLADLELLIAQICNLGKFVMFLGPFLHPRARRRYPGDWPPPLPDKFPPPRTLSSPPPEGPPSAKRSPRSSRKQS